MVLIDYSKIKIYIPKITAYYLMSIYFCILNIYAVFLHEAGHNDYVLIYITAFFVITFAVIKYIYNVSNYAGNSLFYKFLIFTSIVFIIYILLYDNPVYALIISSIFSIIYTVNALNLLATYSVMEKDFLNKYKNMININTYIVSFAIVIVCAFVIYCLIHMLNLGTLLYFFDIRYYNSILKLLAEFGRASVDAPVIILGVLFFLTYVLSHIYVFFLSKYRYVFIICALSEYQQIPLSAVYKIPLLLQNSEYKNEAIQNWFQSFIGNYVNNVYLDIDRELIIFNSSKNYEQDEDKNEVIEPPVINNDESSEEAVYSLDNAVKKIEALMAKVVYRGTNLTKSLYTMKLYLEKINKLHTNKLSYDKYIDRINNKYIPYVEYLVEIYLRNIDLKDESLSEVQEKIVYTLDEIAYVLQMIYESKIEFIKFNLEVELDTVDLLIKQKGYSKGIL